MNNPPDSAMNTPPAGSTAAASLAGNVLRKIPIHDPLRLFKGLYYTAFLLNFRRTLKSWRMCKHNIRIADETGTAMN